METDVVIVGAGPTGLMLARELRLGGVHPLVLDRLAAPASAPKANGIGGRIYDVFDRRGLLEPLAAASGYAGPVPRFPFGTVPLELHRLADNPVRMLLIQQPDLERVLGEGVEVTRDHEVTALGQDADGVTLGIRGGAEIRARYVVGCDGARSAVRRLAGIGFPGHTSHEVHRLAHLVLDPAVVVPGTGELDLPGFGRLKPGSNRTERGTVTLASFRPGVHLVAVAEDGTPPEGEATLAELQAAARRVLGVELPVTEAIWVSRVVPNSRQAETYRDGRVLLAGDAAHTFAGPGGAPLNVALLDTVNLGWKLAAEIRGDAPPGLLDTYHAERHPVGQRVLMQTRAQVALMAGGPEAEALRALFGEILGDDVTLRRIAELMAGADVRYPMPGAPDHPLTGRFVPAGTPVGEALRGSRFALVTADVALGEEVGKWRDRVDVVPWPEAPVAALLVRPDGHVAWVSPDGTPRGLREALTTWAGTPV
ncbi:FAD-dependent monooxygenase [Streptosporangiaceae bacterium NEAU-GS5]|nr:FAD-dependent monooxygenase [Streptosporangiaceae bacterium NEAU-GS5]